MIRVQRQDFDIGAELEKLSAGNPRIGGVASFVGLVRDMGGPDRITALTLEHYPGMTEKKLAEIEAEANRRWPLDASLIIHRFGQSWSRATASCAGRDGVAAPRRPRSPPLPLPNRLAEDRRAVLEERGNVAGRALGRKTCRGRRSEPTPLSVASGGRAGRRYRQIGAGRDRLKLGRAPAPGRHRIEAGFAPRPPTAGDRHRVPGRRAGQAD